jgi:hypothetical protein
MEMTISWQPCFCLEVGGMNAGIRIVFQWMMERIPFTLRGIASYEREDLR